MYTQVTHLYQRGPNDQSPTGQQHSNNGSNSSNGGSPRKNNRQVLKFSLLILGIVLILWTIALMFSQGSNAQQNVGELQYSAFYQQVQAGNVKDVTFQGQDITGDFKNAISLNDADGNPVLTTQFHLIQLPNGDPNLIILLNQNHVQYQAKPVPNTNPLLSILVGFLPLILVIGIIFLSVAGQRKASRTSSALARPAPGLWQEIDRAPPLLMSRALKRRNTTLSRWLNF